MFPFADFQDSNDPVIRLAYEKYLAEDLPTNAESGLKIMCKDPKFSFLFFNNDIFRFETDCTILQIPKPVFVTWDGFRLRENSPYMTIFNRL